MINIIGRVSMCIDAALMSAHDLVTRNQIRAWTCSSLRFLNAVSIDKASDFTVCSIRQIDCLHRLRLLGVQPMSMSCAREALVRARR